MRLGNRTKQIIRKEQEKLLCKMSNNCTQEEWEKLHKKYMAYEEMLAKSTLKLSLDTIFMGGINILGMLLILNYEKVDIVRSKAMNFAMKWRA